MSSLTTGNLIVDQVGEINFSGDIIPPIWYKTITKENGKPNLLSVVILSSIVYWYKPTIERDERTNHVIGMKKKFHADLLQRSYDELAEFYGVSKGQATEAVICLENLGVVKRVFRTLKVNGLMLANVLFIELLPSGLKNVTYPDNSEGGVPKKTDTLPRKKQIPLSKKRETNTEITTEITTEIKEEEEEEEENSVSIFTTKEEEEINDIADHIFELYKNQINTRQFNELVLQIKDSSSTVEEFQKNIIQSLNETRKTIEELSVTVESSIVRTNENHWQTAYNDFFGPMALMGLSSTRRMELQNFIEKDGLQEELVCHAIRMTSQNVDGSHGYYKYLVTVLANYKKQNIKTIQELEAANEKPAVTKNPTFSDGHRSFVDKKTDKKPKIEVVKPDLTSGLLSEEEMERARAVAKKLNEKLNGITMPHFTNDDDRPF